MPREIGDDEHLVAQRRHQKHVDAREYSGHFRGDLPSKAISLDEIHRGQKTRFTEEIRPRIGNLNLELVRLPTERELLERRGRLGE